MILNNAENKLFSFFPPFSPHFSSLLSFSSSPFLFSSLLQAAQHLKTLCGERGDGRTELEAEAYYLMMKGAWLVERKEYLMALNQCFPAAKSILVRLSHVVEDEEGIIIIFYDFLLLLIIDISGMVAIED